MERMSIKRVTKKHIEEAKDLILKYGYWSQEILEYMDKFEYKASQRLQNQIIVFYPQCRK